MKKTFAFLGFVFLYFSAYGQSLIGMGILPMGQTIQEVREAHGGPLREKPSSVSGIREFVGTLGIAEYSYNFSNRGLYNVKITYDGIPVALVPEIIKEHDQ
jgi:hypothetical protein